MLQPAHAKASVQRAASRTRVRGGRQKARRTHTAHIECERIEAGAAARRPKQLRPGSAGGELGSATSISEAAVDSDNSSSDRSSGGEGVPGEAPAAWRCSVGEGQQRGRQRRRLDVVHLEQRQPSAAVRERNEVAGAGQRRDLAAGGLDRSSDGSAWRSGGGGARARHPHPGGAACEQGRGPANARDNDGMRRRSGGRALSSASGMR